MCEIFEILPKRVMIYVTCARVMKSIIYRAKSLPPIFLQFSRPAMCDTDDAFVYRIYRHEYDTDGYYRQHDE